MIAPALYVPAATTYGGSVRRIASPRDASFGAAPQFMRAATTYGGSVRRIESPRDASFGAAPPIGGSRLTRAETAYGGSVRRVFGVPSWRGLPGPWLPVPFGGTGLGGIEIPDLLTPMTADIAASALAEGYRRVTGKAPDQRILGLLIGQTALETGNWKSIHNWNFGNAKATSSDPYYQNFRCSEIIDGSEQFFDPPDTHCRFAAHLTASDGAEHYIRVLQHRPNWWNGLQTGTVPGFIDGLTAQPYAYFTANKDLYERGLADRMANYATQATKYAGQHKVAVVGTAIGVFAMTFGAWYLYNAMTSKPKAA